ncbi:MAG: hypothetical protein AAGA54_17585 [Myxococcota bacterium]
MPDDGTHPGKTDASAGTLLVAALTSIGFIARALPLLNVGGRLLRQFPTEDGYLMLQIARNMALGHGMSVAAGTMPTNGTQPLTTFVWSLAFRLVDADRVAGVRAVLVLELCIAVLTALLLLRVARRLLPDTPRAQALAPLAAAAHFASPLAVMHSMNTLESGAYAAAVLATVAVLLREAQPPGRWSAVACLRVGMILGGCFWVRNDAVFLIAGVCLAHVWVARRDRASRVRAFIEAVGIGGTTLLIAAPWLYFNLTAFGHLVPVSGIAESQAAAFGSNAYLVPTKLFEYVVLFAPIPERWESSPVIWLFTASALVTGIVLARRRRSASPPSAAVLALVLYAALLCGFYGLVFGTPHFVGRHLFPLSTFAALLGTTAVAAALERTPSRVVASRAGAVLAVLAAATLNARQYARGTEHPHFQVIAWVERHVPASSWVGAIQSGTLGFFHDRTINLDGKVNPDALDAVLRRDLARYIVDQDIDYIVDWVGAASVVDVPPLRGRFEVVELDRARNLGALRRIGAPSRAPDTPEPEAVRQLIE